MNTRKIAYIEPDEDVLQKEVDWAIGVSFEERINTFFMHLQSVYLLAGVDLTSCSIKKSIYYISDNEI